MSEFIWGADFDGFLSTCKVEAWKSVDRLQQAEGDIRAAQDELLDKAVAENRGLLASEQRTVDSLKARATAVRSVLREAIVARDNAVSQRVVVNDQSVYSFGDVPAKRSSGRFATARSQLRYEGTYRPDSEHSFFRDLIQRNDNFQARERLEAQQRESRDAMSETERRTFDTTAASGFAPPQYLGQLWAEVPRASRPLANRLPKYPLTEYGMSIVVPRLTGGGTVAGMGSENSAVSSATPTETDLTVPVVTIAGQIDLSRQSIERTFPGMDTVLWSDLSRAYDEKLETQLMTGTGSTGQHLGLVNVPSAISVTYTASTPTGAALVPVIYNAIQQVASTRYANPNAIVMHPRRAAWLSKEVYSAQAPIVQQGNLMNTVASQDGGFLSTFAGLEVIVSAAMTTTSGTGTNEDRILVLYTDDLYLCESPLQHLRFDDVGSGTLTSRLQVYNYSAFISGREPKSVAVISGTGLAGVVF